MLFKEFVLYLEKLERISSRLEITTVLAELLDKMRHEEVGLGVYLTLGTLGPSFDNPQFNMASKMILRSIAGGANEGVSDMEKKYKQLGDLGELVEKTHFGGHKLKKYTLDEVFHILKRIAMDSGTGSQERKVVMLSELFSTTSSLERKYVARIVMGKLRLGFTEKTIFDALSQLRSGNKDLRKEIDKVYQIYPDAGYITKKVKLEGVGGLEKINVETGVPVVPALCQRLNNYSEIIKKMGMVAVEPKYDGTRVQIHFNRASNTVKTYTRNLEESSAMFPELGKMGKWIKGSEVILDCEAVGVDDNGKILPFQLTITRKRKHGVDETAKNVPLKFFVFDVLSANGKSMIDVPYFNRRKLLKEIVIDNEVLMPNVYVECDEAEQVQKLHNDFLTQGLEGAVIKKWGGKYLPGRQGWNWVKIKESEGSDGKLADTFDLVIMGYYLGRGKRAAFGIGAFLVGLIKEDRWITIAKIGTGLSDEEFKDLKKRLEAIKVSSKPENYFVSDSLLPDVWVEPKIVVEVAADELTKSPNHTGGLALRFPRLIKFRDDKSSKEATTWKEVLDIAKLQEI